MNSNLPYWFFIEIPLNFKKVQNDVIKVMRWLQNLTMTKYCCKQFDIFLFVAKRFFMFFCLDASYIVVFLKTKFSSNYQCNLNLNFSGCWRHWPVHRRVGREAFKRGGRRADVRLSFGSTVSDPQERRSILVRKQHSAICIHKRWDFYTTTNNHYIECVLNQ